jgi:D-3-phosphoglycerate dehydrogenase
MQVAIQEFPSGSREDFIRNLKDGKYDDLVAIYRSNASTKVFQLQLSVE